jgi:putative hydrolase of HD superfamily
LALALLHDLPESLTTDIPPRVWLLMPAGLKQEAEQKALGEILGDLPLAPAMLELWAELVANETPEARLVHDADKLELFLQAVNYEAESGNSRLEEFWQRRPSFHFPITDTLFESLKKSAGR